MKKLLVISLLASVVSSHGYDRIKGTPYVKDFTPFRNTHVLKSTNDTLCGTADQLGLANRVFYNRFNHGYVQCRLEPQDRIIYKLNAQGQIEHMWLENCKNSIVLVEQTTTTTTASTETAVQQTTATASVSEGFLTFGRELLSAGVQCLPYLLQGRQGGYSDYSYYRPERVIVEREYYREPRQSQPIIVTNTNTVIVKGGGNSRPQQPYCPPTTQPPRPPYCPPTTTPYCPPNVIANAPNSNNGTGLVFDANGNQVQLTSAASPAPTQPFGGRTNRTTTAATTAAAPAPVTETPAQSLRRNARMTTAGLTAQPSRSDIRQASFQLERPTRSNPVAAAPTAAPVQAPEPIAPIRAPRQSLAARAAAGQSNPIAPAPIASAPPAAPAPAATLRARELRQQVAMQQRPTAPVRSQAPMVRPSVPAPAPAPRVAPAPVRQAPVRQAPAPVQRPVMAQQRIAAPAPVRMQQAPRQQQVNVSRQQATRNNGRSTRR